jgi:hypothetical protein
MSAAATNETDIVQATLLRLGAREGLRIWRNNTGRLPDKHGRFVVFGLKGSADIIGIMRVGGVGVFVAIECKTKTGKQRAAQLAFQRMVESLGGCYVLARSADEAESALDAWRARVAA